MHPHATGPSPRSPSSARPLSRPARDWTRGPPPAGRTEPVSRAETAPGALPFPCQHPLPSSLISLQIVEGSFHHRPPNLLELEMGRLKPRRHPPPGLPFPGPGLGPGRGGDGDSRKGAPPGGGLRAGAEADVGAAKSARGSNPTLAQLAGSGRSGPSESPRPSGRASTPGPQGLRAGRGRGPPASRSLLAFHSFQGLASACASAAPGKEARALFRPRDLRRVRGLPGAPGGRKGAKVPPQGAPLEFMLETRSLRLAMEPGCPVSHRGQATRIPSSWRSTARRLGPRRNPSRASRGPAAEPP